MRVTLDFPAAEEILQEVGLDEQGDAQMFHTKNVLRRVQKYIAGCWRKWQKRSLRQHGQSTGKKYVRAAANYAANKLTAGIRRTRYANAKNGWRRS